MGEGGRKEGGRMKWERVLEEDVTVTSVYSEHNQTWTQYNHLLAQMDLCKG